MLFSTTEILVVKSPSLPENPVIKGGLISLVKKEMESAFLLKVPLVVDLNYGQNWFEAH